MYLTLLLPPATPEDLSAMLVVPAISYTCLEILGVAQTSTNLTSLKAVNLLEHHLLSNEICRPSHQYIESRAQLLPRPAVNKFSKSSCDRRCIDAVSIDQKNNTNRTKQLNRMRDIYGGAQRTFAWLEDRTLESKKEIDCFNGSRRAIVE